VKQQEERRDGESSNPLTANTPRDLYAFSISELRPELNEGELDRLQRLRTHGRCEQSITGAHLCDG
jgi:hypothetical protein